MSRKRIVSCFARLAAILALFDALALVNSSWAVSPADAADLLPVNSFLNDDGTLNLASAPHGTFDLRGWNVTLDAARGPVLAPLGSGANAPSAVGDWSALGSNGSGDGSLNSYVSALAVSGTNLYVGGLFTNVNNGGVTLGTADYIAKWDGTNWSALGDNGSGNGSLNSLVTALAVSGSDLYVGGNFTYVNNGGTTLNAANYVAKWDGTNWSALGSNGLGGGSLSSYVYALAVGGSDLYVGGGFINVYNGGTTLTAADWVAKHEINVPTAADLAAFTARVNAQQHVVVRWRTDNEMNLVGFNVYRATKKRGIYKRLNKELIAAKHPGQVLGANYSRTNKRVKAGKTYFYKLELVRANGASEWSAVRRVTLP